MWKRIVVGIYVWNIAFGLVAGFLASPWFFLNIAVGVLGLVHLAILTASEERVHVQVYRDGRRIYHYGSKPLPAQEEK